MLLFAPRDHSRHDWLGAIRLLSHFHNHLSGVLPRLESHRGYLVDIYEPPTAPSSTVIFTPGLSIHGREDPRLRRFGFALQSAGLRVLIPDVPSLRALRITTEQPSEIKQLLISLAKDSNLVTTPHLALMSVSFSSVFVLGAATESVLCKRLNAIGLIGGYFDIEKVARFLLTSPIADPYGKLVIVRSYLEEIGSCDSDTLDLLDRAIHESAIQNSRAIPLDQLFDNASPKQASVLRLLAEPQSCGEIYDNVVNLFKHSWLGYSTAIHVPNSMCPVFLLHGREDRVIPVEQSRWLSASLAETGVPHRLCVSDLLAHGNATISFRRAIEIYRLIRAFAWFLGRAKGVQNQQAG